MTKNICILHGYLLEGSGSNIYVQNIARAHCKKGHTVYLVCQERKLKNYDFVASHSTFDATNTKLITHFKKKTPYQGKCHVFNPHIGPLLPVYVKDHYEYFKHVKEFPTLSETELTFYIQKNVAALTTLFKHHSIDLIHAQHVIMSPYIAHLALEHVRPEFGGGWKKIPYLITCHGSELNYSIKGHPHLKKYGDVALQHATYIFSASSYLDERLLNFFSKRVPQLKFKLRRSPCGVNAAHFKPIYKIKISNIDILKQKIKEKLNRGDSSPSAQNDIFSQFSSHDLHNRSLTSIDPHILETLHRVKWGKDRVILYLGRYLPAKGPQMLLKAAPYLFKKYPDLKILCVGYGIYRKELEALAHVKKELNQRIFFTGKLEHPELRYLLPLADILVVPSLFPESFGMVAAEGLASGVPTLVAYHSGLRDIHDIVSKILHTHHCFLKKIYPNSRFVDTLVSNIQHLFEKKLTRNTSFKKSLHVYARQHFSWDKISEALRKSLK